MTSTDSYRGSTFKEVRDQVFSDPYATLPMHTITLGSFYHGLANMLLRATSRALNDSSDLAPYFQKLVHPNGVALTGTWNITEKSDYTGYFSQGSKALIIVRCSTLLYKTTRGSDRGFAFAGKLFPTMDPNQRVKTADFLTIDVLAGTKAAHYTDVALTNEPPLGFNLDVIRLLGVVIATFGSFIRADFNPVFRPTYPVAELGLPEGAVANSPRWIMVRAWPGSGQSEEEDFRNELKVENYVNKTLRFNVSAASKRLLSGDRDWRYLGHIDLTESVASESCDHRLVFQHPKLKET
jgi:hypothetical protein